MNECTKAAMQGMPKNINKCSATFAQWLNLCSNASNQSASENNFSSMRHLKTCITAKYYAHNYANIALINCRSLILLERLLRRNKHRLTQFDPFKITF